MDIVIIFGYGFIMLLGLALGSFFGSWLWRAAAAEQPKTKRSQCPACARTLGWLELVPVLSFVVLRGKCRGCQAPISWQYPLIELATMALVLFAAWFHVEIVQDNPLFFLRDIVFLSLLLVVFVFDARHRLVLLGVTIAGTIFALLTHIFVHTFSWPSLCVGVIIGGGFFGLQYIISRGRWIGAGDIYVGVMMGAMLGFPRILVALFFAYVGGALAAVVLLLAHKKQLGGSLPLAVFLAPATLVALFFGTHIIDWYLSLLV